VPRQTGPFLREELRELTAATTAGISRQVADLESTDLATWARARDDLEKLAGLAEPALLQALAAQPAPAARARLQQLLKRLQESTASGEGLRHFRAVEVLEHLNSAEGRALLEALARGVPKASLAQEARAALARLTPRGAPVEPVARPVPVPGPAPWAHASGQRDAHGDPLPPGALVRVGTARFRHGNHVSCIAFSPDGKIVASGGWNGRVCLWEAATGRLLRSLDSSQPGQLIFGLAFAPDGKTLAAGASGPDPSLRRWEVATGKELPPIAVPGQPRCVAFAPDGKTIACAGLDRTIRLLDPTTGKEIAQLAGHTGFVNGLQFSPGGKTLISGSLDQTIRLWDVARGKELRRFEANQPAILTVALSRDGAWLASGGQEQTVRLWDVATGREERQFQIAARDVTSVALSPDGKTLAAAGQDTSIYLWETATGTELRRFSVWQDAVKSVAFSPDGKTLAASDGPILHSWDVATGRETPPAEGPRGPVTAVAFAPDGQSLALCCRRDGLRVFTAATGRERRYLGGRAEGDLCVAFSPDGKLLATAGGMDRVIRLWPAAGGAEGRRLQGHPFRVSSVAFSPDGKVLASSDFGGTVVLWEAASGKELRQWKAHPANAVSVAFSPDGKFLASGGMRSEGRRLVGEVKLWDVTTGGAVRTCAGQYGPGDQIAFSPDGRMLACGSGGTIYLWEVLTGQERGRVGRNVEAGCVAFSPDGRLMAAAGRSSSWFTASPVDGTIRFWRTGTGTEVGQLQGHRGGIHAITFSPDGTRLVSGGEDSTALIWDMTGAGQEPVQPEARVAAEVLDAWWTGLADEDAVRAYRAVGGLIQAAEQAVPLLQARLHPAAVSDAEHLNQLIADLDSPRFAVRQKSSTELAQLGKQAEPALRKALEGQPSAEARRRIERLLASPGGTQPTPEQMREARALEVLENIGTPAARHVLEVLARGASGSRLTQEAQASLKRLNRRPGAAP
jgi:WD40 repeat protein